MVLVLQSVGSIKLSNSNCSFSLSLQFPVDLVIFTEKTLNRNNFIFWSVKIQNVTLYTDFDGGKNFSNF